MRRVGGLFLTLGGVSGLASVIAIAATGITIATVILNAVMAVAVTVAFACFVLENREARRRRAARRA